jgi:integral membrane protein (TIGR01906 family)
MKISTRIYSILTSAIIPFFLLMTAIRLLITPLYPQIEYRMPGFPQDPYGFTLADRLKWSAPSLDYLLNNKNITYLSDLRFADGTPIYNDRELSHMFDVKKVVQNMLAWHAGLTGLLLLFVAFAWRGKWLPQLCRALGWGGWLTIGMMAAILVWLAINFRDLFTNFHMIFFEGDTWLFYWTDTLIRLFPMQFWQDAFIGVGIFTLAGAGLLVWVGKKWGR